jgi:hypothetical protein
MEVGCDLRSFTLRQLYLHENLHITSIFIKILLKHYTMKKMHEGGEDAMVTLPLCKGPFLNGLEISCIPRGGLDVVAKKKSLPLTGIETRTSSPLPINITELYKKSTIIVSECDKCHIGLHRWGI